MIFGYKASKKDGNTIFLLQGELIDRNQSTELMQDLETAIAANEVKFVLNLAELKYLNSSGLNVLINILTKSRKAGGDVAICNVNKKINELLVITKLNSVFNVSDSEENAIKILNK